jgi:hypothetical protein
VRTGMHCKTWWLLSGFSWSVFKKQNLMLYLTMMYSNYWGVLSSMSTSLSSTPVVAFWWLGALLFGSRPDHLLGHSRCLSGYTTWMMDLSGGSRLSTARRWMPTRTPS